MRRRTRGSGSAKVREMARVPLGKIPEAKIRGARGRAGMPKVVLPVVSMEVGGICELAKRIFNQLSSLRSRVGVGYLFSH